MNNIKWCAIQPLTGGMYIGTEEAIGHKAEFILSYPGLAEPNIDEETGKVISAGNEYSLMKFLEKRNDLPEYRVFNRAMFQKPLLQMRDLIQNIQVQQHKDPY